MLRLPSDAISAIMARNGGMSDEAAALEELARLTCQPAVSRLPA